MLPLTIGYIGGYNRAGGAPRSQAALLADAASFAAGLATTLAGLGVLASLFGKAYGQARAPRPLGCVGCIMLSRCLTPRPRLPPRSARACPLR